MKCKVFIDKQKLGNSISNQIKKIEGDNNLKEYTKKFLEIIKNKYKENPEQYEKLPISMKMNDFKELPYFKTSFAVKLKDVKEELENTDLFYHIECTIGDNLEFYLSDKGKDFFNNKIEKFEKKESTEKITINNIYGGNNQIGDHNIMDIKSNEDAIKIIDECMKFLNDKSEYSLNSKFEELKKAIIKSNKTDIITRISEIMTIGSTIIVTYPFISEGINKLLQYFK